MHEAHLMSDLLRKIEALSRANDSSRIVGIEVWLGALCHVSAAHFREHFEHATRGTPMAGATLGLVVSDDANHPQAQDIVLRSVSLDE